MLYGALYFHWLATFLQNRKILFRSSRKTYASGPSVSVVERKGTRMSQTSSKRLEALESNPSAKIDGFAFM